jgi:hypothetical protein
MTFIEIALDVVSKVGPKMFPISRSVKVVRYGFEVTNSTNPIIIVGNIILTVIEYCFPSPIKLAAVCIAAGASVISMIVPPNPILLDATAHFIDEVKFTTIAEN